MGLPEIIIEFKTKGVTAIKPFAFAGATFVSVTINVTVTVIGDSAFENCTVSASVSFMNSQASM